MQVKMRRSWWPLSAATAAATVLTVAAATYWYTVEPAPAVKVRWRDGVTAGERSALERRFRLVDPIAAEGRTITYNVLDTSPGNLQAVVNEPAIEDTSDIDRTRYTLPADVPYGTRWMWLADRLPVLRAPGVSLGVMAACLLLLAASSLRVRGTGRKVAPENGSNRRL